MNTLLDAIEYESSLVEDSFFADMDIDELLNDPFDDPLWDEILEDGVIIP